VPTDCQLAACDAVHALATDEASAELLEQANCCQHVCKCMAAHYSNRAIQGQCVAAITVVAGPCLLSDACEMNW
jgi:hypothetical protein